MNQYYENAKEKGFHDNDTFGPDGTPDARTRIVFAGLILTEWREQRLDKMTGLMWRILDETTPTPGKPVGELSEWADVWIRCADALGACKVQLDGYESYHTGPDTVCMLVATAIENVRVGDFTQYAACLRGIMSHARARMAILRSDDLSLPQPGLAIAIKHAYNKTRPRKHGKLA